jgi:hypothetical protein
MGDNRRLSNDVGVFSDIIALDSVSDVLDRTEKNVEAIVKEIGKGTLSDRTLKNVLTNTINSMQQLAKLQGSGKLPYTSRRTKELKGAVMGLISTSMAVFKRLTSSTNRKTSILIVFPRF